MSVWVLEFEGFDPATRGTARGTVHPRQRLLRDTRCGGGSAGRRRSLPGDVHRRGVQPARDAPSPAARSRTRASSTPRTGYRRPSASTTVAGWKRLRSSPSRQELDLRRGVLTRFLSVRDDAGRITPRDGSGASSLLDEPHLAALETTIASENWSGRLRIRSLLHGSADQLPASPATAPLSGTI